MHFQVYSHGWDCHHPSPGAIQRGIVYRIIVMACNITVAAEQNADACSTSLTFSLFDLNVHYDCEIHIC